MVLTQKLQSHYLKAHMEEGLTYKAQAHLLL